MKKKPKLNYNTKDDLSEYISKLSPEEKRFAKNFYNNEYSDTSTDAMDAGYLVNADENREFMEEATDSHDWYSEYKLNGFEAAIKIIHEQTLRDLDNNNIDIDVVLNSYYVKRSKLSQYFEEERMSKKESYLNKNAKKVLDTKTGRIYRSIFQAAKASGISYAHLQRKINNKNNDTGFVLLNKTKGTNNEK